MLIIAYAPPHLSISVNRFYKRICAWKVYGDEEKAQRIFEKYKKWTESYCRSYRAGRKLEELAVAI